MKTANVCQCLACATQPGGCQRGQALIESIFAVALLSALAALLIVLGKYQSVHLAAIGASRAAAFHCAMLPLRCADRAGKAPDSDKLTTQHFGRGVATLNNSRFWSTRAGDALIEDANDTRVSLSKQRFDAGIGVAKALPGPARPSKFGLKIRDGLVLANVNLSLLDSRGPSTISQILSGMPLQINAQTAILIDHWNASAPEGDAGTSVKARVSRGQQIDPRIETAIKVGYTPIMGIMKIMDPLRLERAAGDFKYHQIDMDIVPLDRVESP